MKNKWNKQRRKSERKNKLYWPSARRLKNDQEVHYIIARHEIENCHTERLIHDLRISPDNPLVRLAHGNVSFSVDGYGDDPRELVEIPEFVRFIRQAAESNPCWIYFTMPETNWLNFVLSACGSTGEIEVDRDNHVLRVKLVLGETTTFFLRQLDDYETLCRYGRVDDVTKMSFLHYISAHYMPGFDKAMAARMNGGTN